MTPKEQYEARKAKRQERRETEETLGRSTADTDTQEMLDRFVTAVERIADALEPTIMAADPEVRPTDREG